MSLGGFSTLTPEQRGRCLLLGIDVVTGAEELPGVWFITHIENELKVLVDKTGEMKKYKSVDEAILDYTRNQSRYTWA